MDIGTKLKEARLRSGLTQEQAAQAAQVSRQTMSSWENGRSVPDVVSVVRLAKVYGISLDELVREGGQAQEQVSFLERHWDALYSAAVAAVPLAVLAEYFLSLGAALAVLMVGTVLFALPRLLFARVFGGGLANAALGLLGWALVLGRTVWSLTGGPFSLTSHLVAMLGVGIVIFVRYRERGGGVRKLRWHNWVVGGLIVLSPVLIWFSGALEGGDLNEANPFLHIYRIEEAEYGQAPGPLLVELSYEEILCFLDPGTDTSEKIGQFRYLEPSEAELETVAGIWQMVPEGRTEELYRLTVETDGEIRLSFLKNEELQWRYRLVRADTLRWTAGTRGQVSGGLMEWYPAGTFSGNLDSLNRGTIAGSGTVAFTSEEPVDQLTVTERRYHNGQEEKRTIVLSPNDSGGFSLELETRHPGEEYALYSIPWADGDYWFMVEFE